MNHCSNLIGSCLHVLTCCGSVSSQTKTSCLFSFSHSTTFSEINEATVFWFNNRALEFLNANIYYYLPTAYAWKKVRNWFSIDFCIVTRWIILFISSTLLVRHPSRFAQFVAKGPFWERFQLCKISFFNLTFISYFIIVQKYSIRPRSFGSSFKRQMENCNKWWHES